MGPMGPLGPMTGPQGFMELATQGFPPLPPPLPLPGMNDSPLEFSTNKNQPPVIRESTEDTNDRRSEKSDGRRERESRDARDTRETVRRSRSDRGERRERDRDRRDEKNDRERRDSRRLEERTETSSTGSNNGHGSNSHNGSDVTTLSTNASTSGAPGISQQIESATGVWGMGVGYPMMGMGPMGPMGPMMSEMALGAHLGHSHGYGAMNMSMLSHDAGTMLSAQILAPDQIMSDTAAQLISGGLQPPPTTQQGTKEIIHCKSCTLFPPNPNAPPPTTRERPPGCRTIFVGGISNIYRDVMKYIHSKKHVNRDSHIASSPISQSSFFEEVRCLILASSQKKLRGYIEFLKFDVIKKKSNSSKI